MFKITFIGNGQNALNDLSAVRVTIVICMTERGWYEDPKYSYTIRYLTPLTNAEVACVTRLGVQTD